MTEKSVTDDVLHVVLRDGTRVLVRPIRSEDQANLEVGLARLSPRSRYLRFHGVVDHLSEAQLRYFTEIDHRDHMAWVAIDEDHPAWAWRATSGCLTNRPSPRRH